jgi:prepilin-type N-terminal cleavage/methylation domain-containing protein
MKRTSPQARHPIDGFTLVELLVVIAIIGVLVALLLPAVQAAREAARRSSCINRIKQISLACLNHESALGHFPPATDALNPNADPATRRDYSWINFILPYMEHQALRDSIDDTVDWFHPNNETPALTTLGAFHCPSREPREWVNLFGPGGSSGGFGEEDKDSALRTHYMAILGANTDLDTETPPLPDYCDDFSSPYSFETETNGTSRRTVEQCITGNHGKIANSGIMYRYSRTKMGEVSDGTSNTFVIGESAFGDGQIDRTRPWIVGATNVWMYGAKNVGYPINGGDRPGPNRNDIGFGSEHPGGCHFAFTDGSANFFSENIELRVLFNLAARNDGAVIDSSNL